MPAFLTAAPSTNVFIVFSSIGLPNISASFIDGDPEGSQPTKIVSALTYLKTEQSPEPKPPPPTGKNKKSTFSSLISSKISKAIVP